MRQIILDTVTLTQNDIDFTPLTSICETEFYDILPKSEIIRVCSEADIILCNKAVIDREIIDSCKNLKFIGLFATGYNNIDINYAAEKGIAVCNVPGYSTDSVAQLAFTFIMMFATNAHKYNDSVHNGDWIRSHTFSYFPFGITELRGKRLGIFGCGAIGRSIGNIGEAFGMDVVYTSRTKRDGYKFVDFDTLLETGDFISLNCPLTAQTEKLINADTLAKMKKSAYLINTSRGGVINEDDLADALKNGVIAGAGLDVMTVEPMKADNVLLSAPNCIITPHVAWASLEARTRLIIKVAENVKAFINGTVINKVN